MKNLKHVDSFLDIKEKKSYVMFVEPYMGEGDPQSMLGTGKQVIKLIKDTHGYSKEDYPKFDTFLLEADDCNGEGYDLIRLFEI